MIALRGATKSRTGEHPGARSGAAASTSSCGDWVVGDADGVVVVPEATLADVINAGRVRAVEGGRDVPCAVGRTTVELLEPRLRAVDADPPISESDAMKVLIATDGSEHRVQPRRTDAGALLGDARPR